MGIFGKILGTVTGGLLGGDDGPKGYVSPNISEYEKKLKEGIYGRMKPGYINPADARKGYDFSGIDTAQKKMGEYTPFKETYKSGYKPTSYQQTNFKFQSLPKEYGDLAYASGSKGIRREGSGQLEKLRETVGPRRTGLLLKAGEDSQRNIGEQLADLQSKIRLSEMEKATDLGVKEQMAQADENYRKAGFDEDATRFGAGEGFKEYGSRADLEKLTADERIKRDTGAMDAAVKKLGIESDVTERERDYADRALEYLKQLFGDVMGSKNQAEATGASAATAKRGQTLGFLGSLLGR